MAMSVFSAEAWAKVWTYRGTFLLGLRNTAATAVFAILLIIPSAVLIFLMRKYIGPEAIVGGFKMK